MVQVGYDIVVGNLLLSAVKKNIMQVSKTQVFDFDKEVAKKIKKDGFYMENIGSICDTFVDQYPYLVEKTEQGIKIKLQDGGKEGTEKVFNRYFRLGIPTSVAKAMDAVAEYVLDG